MAEVTVFVDDAVCGRLPPVCAKTGRPSDGRLSIAHDIGGGSTVPTALMLLLLLLPPIGWLVLLVLAIANPRRSEWLHVELPWTTDTAERVRALRTQLRALWIGAMLGVVGVFAALIASANATGGNVFAYRLALFALLAATLGCVVAALVVERRVGRHSVSVELDASRRWVTLRGVAPEFVRAVRAAQSRSDQAHPPY
jgi:hypothetical protein